MKTLVNKNGSEDWIALFEKIKMMMVKKTKKEIKMKVALLISSISEPELVSKLRIRQVEAVMINHR